MSLEAIKKEFTLVYERENDALFRFCLWRVTNREVAVELTQEAFTRLWANMINGKIHNARAFLYTVTRRLIIDWYRKFKSYSLEAMSHEEGRAYEPEDEKALDTLEASPEARRVVALLDQLSTEHREVIYLRFIEGLEPREIASMLNTTANAVSIRITRGLEALRRLSGIEKLE